MGNSSGRSTASTGYVATETFHCSEHVFHDFQQSNMKKADQLKIENPLNITMGDQLEMLTEDTGLLGPNETKLYKMRNRENGEVGLVLADYVVKIVDG